MQAISTKTLNPTNFKGTRVKASCEAKTITLSWDHSQNAEGNHKAAALHLCSEMDWPGTLACGQLPDGTYAHVFVDEATANLTSQALMKATAQRDGYLGCLETLLSMFGATSDVRVKEIKSYMARNEVRS